MLLQLDPIRRQIALSTTGFMPEDEGDALFAAALVAGESCPRLPMVEIGSYCGRSTVWFGAAAEACGAQLFAVDHHGGSEENQIGWEWHDPTLVDSTTGLLNTLPHFEHTMKRAGLNKTVHCVVGDSPTIASKWTEKIALCFIDGGHARDVAARDYAAWSPHICVDGFLVIHDVFVDPALGGQAPYEEIYLAAIRSTQFVKISATGSLRVLRRIK